MPVQITNCFADTSVYVHKCYNGRFVYTHTASSFVIIENCYTDTLVFKGNCYVATSVCVKGVDISV